MQDKRFATFVVRYWVLPHDERRLEIEHTQSGERHHCASLLEAEAWLAARARTATPGGPRPADSVEETPKQRESPDNGAPG
jgi:hypothetical protein